MESRSRPWWLDRPASYQQDSRAMEWRARPWWLWVLAGLIALAALAAIILLVWKLPLLLYGDVSKASPDARLQAASGFRTALVAGLAGLAALGSLAIATRTYRLTQQGQITDRYTKAIEQLGSDKQDMRLGGIYALERIANDSPPDRATIEEVLTAFVRGHAPWPPRSPGQPDKDITPADLQPLRSWAPDVQAALTVLGRRRPPTGQPQRLLLDATDLRHAYLRDADLRDAIFTGARLQGADLRNARLQHAYFRDAILQRADLSGAQLQDGLFHHAQLQKAQLWRAQLQGAEFLDAQLQDADLREANLQGAAFNDSLLQRAILTLAQGQHADLSAVQLQGASLWRAQLQGANLTGAQLQEADLRAAQLQEADLRGAQLERAQCNAATAWPAGFDWKAAGVNLRDRSW
jgi:uncharacterized protein YjbI with pentapeptide repeats